MSGAFMTASGVPQHDLQNMTQSQLLQCANVFYNAWVACNQQLEEAKRSLEDSYEQLREDKTLKTMEVNRLQRENAIVQQKLFESLSLGKALHKRTLEITLACAAEVSPSEQLYRNQLNVAQCRILELERLLRLKVSPNLSGLMDENEVLRNQREKDASKISTLSMEIETLKASKRKESLSNFIALTPEPSGQITEAVMPAAATVRLSKGIQTMATVPAIDSQPSQFAIDGASVNVTVLLERVKSLEASLSLKDSLIDDLHALPILSSKDADNLFTANVTIQRLRKDLDDKNAVVRETSQSVQKMLERYNKLSLETSELRVALQETRASRARLALEMKESRIVSHQKLKELLKISDTMQEFEAQRSHLQRRDKFCGELEVICSERARSVEALQREVSDHQVAHTLVAAECESLRGLVSDLQATCHSLTTQIAVYEHSRVPLFNHQEAKVDLVPKELAELKCQLTMSMNDTRFLEHEALIRDEYLSSVTLITNIAFKLYQSLKADVVQNELLKET